MNNKPPQGVYHPLLGTRRPEHHALFGRANELLAAVLSARPSSKTTARISRLLEEVSQTPTMRN